jgi:hypothetical protein
MPGSRAPRPTDPTNPNQFVTNDSTEIPMPTQNDTTQTTQTFEAALDARRAAIQALPEAMIMRRVALDLVTASSMASGAVGTVQELRPALVARFGAEVDPLIDGLDTTARAARQADIELRMMEEASDLADLHEEVMTTYQRLILDADSLVVRGFLPKERLASFRDLRSYQGTLQSLLGLIAVFRKSWSELEAHTPVRVGDLDRANDVASRMSAALSKRQHGAARAEAIEMRTRAFSLLLREYEELRRMVVFVRWFEGDYDRFVPSLYVGRGGRGKLKGPEPVDTDDVVVTDDDAQPVTPVAGPVPNNGGPAFVS